MGSRIREKAERLFEVFLEVAKPDGEGEVPFVVQQFPEEYDDKEALAMIPKFTFPCESDSSKVDHFSFVLTDVDSMFRFGYCRHSTGHQTCLCIVSWLPWCEIFYKMLDLLAELTNRSEQDQVKDFLQAAYSHEVPASKVPVTIVSNDEMFNFTAPDPNSLPSIPGSRYLNEYYNAVDTFNMMHIFASMLHERRIYMTSKKLSRLTSCVFAAEALLYPMHWQHIFIPVLPSYLIEYLSSPIPYLIGVHGNLIPKLTEYRVDVADAVVVDLDNNTVTTEYEDLANLPEDVANSLKKDLKAETLRVSMLKTGDAISMAFLKALVRLIGGYRDALKFRPGEPITFDPKAFVQSRPSQSTQAFLEGMLSLQIFMQFIHGRLEILNAGIGFKDIFEQQATLYADKLNSQSGYEKWLEIAKKKSKNGFMGVKVKAAPMMSTAVNSLKEQSKRAMTKISGLTDNEDKKGGHFKPTGGVVHSKHGKGRPYSTIDGSAPKSERPPRPPPPSNGYKSKTDSLIRPQSINMRSSCVEKEESHDDSQLRLSYHRMDMSLMEDTDIQAAMLRSASAEILPSEGSMGSSSTPSSVSLEETDSANIPFGNMNSSDEALNVLSVSDLHSSSQAAPSKEESLIGPVAPPRMKKKSQKSSPVASPQAGASRAGVGAATATVALPIPAPPKPLPRQSSLRLSQNAGESETMSHTTLQDAPLIKFDSSESETPDSDVFDPLKMKSPEDGTSLAGVAFSSSGFENSLEGEESKKLVRSRDSRSSLNRAKAFRRESSGVPLRPSYKEDSPDNSSATPSPKKEQEQEAFDPLSEVAGLSVTGSEENPSSTGRNRREVEQERRRRSSSKLLMHEWSLDSLASLSKGPTLSLPSHHSTNPFLQQPAAVATGKQYGLYPSMQHGQGQSQLPHFHPHYSLAYAGSGPLPPPGRLPTSFLAPFNHPQTAGPAPVPPASSTPPTVRPSQKPAAPRVQSQALSHGRLLPTPASSGGGPTRRTLPPAPGSRLSMPASALMAKASSNNSHTPEASSNQQADSLNDLIGIDFGGGAQQPVHQQQQQADAPPPRLRQTKWETFD